MDAKWIGNPVHLVMCKFTYDNKSSIPNIANWQPVLRLTQSLATNAIAILHLKKMQTSKMTSHLHKTDRRTSRDKHNMDARGDLLRKQQQRQGKHDLNCKSRSDFFYSNCTFIHVVWIGFFHFYFFIDMNVVNANMQHLLLSI